MPIFTLMQVDEGGYGYSRVSNVETIVVHLCGRR